MHLIESAGNIYNLEHIRRAKFDLASEGRPASLRLSFQGQGPEEVLTGPDAERLWRYLREWASEAHQSGPSPA